MVMLDSVMSLNRAFHRSLSRSFTSFTMSTALEPFDGDGIFPKIITISKALQFSG